MEEVVRRIEIIRYSLFFFFSCLKIRDTFFFVLLLFSSLLFGEFLFSFFFFSRFFRESRSQTSEDSFVQRRKTKDGRFLRSSTAALEHFANKRSPKATQTEAKDRVTSPLKCSRVALSPF